MQNSISNLRTQILVTICLVAIATPVLQAEPRCPGNIASVTPRFVQRALIVIPVKINQKGPFDFMVDTGSQVTVMDPLLAAQLDLKARGTVGLISVTSYSAASSTVVDTLEAGSHVIEKSSVFVHDLGQIQDADARIRGVLGVNFLAHFNLLIDYHRKLLCLDESEAAGEKLRGERIPFVASQGQEAELSFAERITIAVHLSGTGNRRILLQVDSGSDGPILYASRKEGMSPLLRRATLREGNVSKAQRTFAVLPPQELQIGHETWTNIPFVKPVSVGQDMPSVEEDGVLPTVLFHRVYISFAKRYVIFDPR
jgi:hypothetical protein